jgi:hypothetical protein
MKTQMGSTVLFAGTFLLTLLCITARPTAAENGAKVKPG